MLKTTPPVIINLCIKFFILHHPLTFLLEFEFKSKSYMFFKNIWFTKMNFSINAFLKLWRNVFNYFNAPIFFQVIINITFYSRSYNNNIFLFCNICFMLMQPFNNFKMSTFCCSYNGLIILCSNIRTLFIKPFNNLKFSVFCCKYNNIIVISINIRSMLMKPLNNLKTSTACC